MELWGCGEREELAVLGMRSDRGKRQIRGENLDRVAEGWKQPFILNEVRGRGAWEGRDVVKASASGSGILCSQQKQGRASLEAGTACALRVLAGDSATRGAQLMVNE